MYIFVLHAEPHFVIAIARYRECTVVVYIPAIHISPQRNEFLYRDNIGGYAGLDQWCETSCTSTE
jgi:hypothetical protein